MDKLREHFEHELSTSNIPYKELADENTLNVWFKQFCNAPKIPSLWLYILQYLNEEEYVDAIENNRTLLQKMQNEFYDHQIKKTLDKRYYISKIKETTISKALFDIAKTREIFLDSIYDNSTDRYKEPKDTSDIIIEQLERLPLSFASAIIQDIQEDDANMHVFIIKEFGDRELSQAEKNKLEKMNNSLIQLLWDWEKSKNNETQKEKDNENKRLEDILLTDEKTAKKIVDALKLKCKGFKGKDLMLLLKALEDLTYINISHGHKTSFHKACSLSFDWDIGTFEGMRKEKYNCYRDKEAIETIKKNITSAIK